MKHYLWRFRSAILMALVGGFIAGLAVAQDDASGSEEPGPLLYYSQAECLRTKADIYRNEAGDGPALIFIGFCEEGIVRPSPGQINPDTTRNSLQDSVIRFTEKQMREVPGLGNLPENMKAVVIVLSWEQITCIRDHFDNVVDVKENTRFTRSGGTGDTVDMVAELKLNECER
ncbi:hypothetical protein GQE99_00105 [Maritimibacter sp. DP07]|uniref:Uncharacterized protein n=1 Tax=Maritimibacter harenae TaxID=2606218 RepID=A0A845M1N4_9RHOB|nr:hypothetical protein [Maritimibacter harenae]MZR11433.1 hypothetical protein [Maritimibacter harenae]